MKLFTTENYCHATHILETLTFKDRKRGIESSLHIESYQICLLIPFYIQFIKGWPDGDDDINVV